MSNPNEEVEVESVTITIEDPTNHDVKRWVEIVDPTKTTVNGILLSELLEEHGRASRRTGVLR
jgi:hypothetical protein